MPEPYEIVLGPFVAGRTARGRVIGASYGTGSEAADPADPNTASDCENVDITDGSLRVVALPATNASSLGSATEFGGVAAGRGLVWVPSRSGFASGNAADRLCSGCPIGTTQNGRITALVQDGNDSALEWPNGTDPQTQIGFDNPPAGTFANGTGGSSRAFVYTYVSNSATYGIDVESNPSPIFVAATAQGGAPATFTPPGAFSHSGFSSGFYRVYATVVGASTGTMTTGMAVTNPAVLTRFFLVATVNAGAGATSIGAVAADLNNPLTWADTVYSDNPIYNLDEGQVPRLIQRMGQAMHGSSRPIEGVEGMLITSLNDRIYMSEAGMPWYAQKAYVRAPGGFVEMIRTNGTTSVISTLSNLYTLTGTTPSDSILELVSSGRPVRYDSGESACWTPWGLVYVGDDGVYLFDGTTCTNLTVNAFTRDDFAAWPKMHAVFADGVYTAYGPSTSANSTGIRIDMRMFPALMITRITLNMPVTGSTVASNVTLASGVFNGRTVAYMKHGGTNVVYPWLQRGDAYGGSYVVTPASSYTWVTQRIGVDERHPKSFQRIYVDYDGTAPGIAYYVYRYGRSAPVAVGSWATDLTQRRFAGDAVGDYVILALTGSPTTVVRRIKITGSVLNGRP